MTILNDIQERLYNVEHRSGCLPDEIVLSRTCYRDLVNENAEWLASHGPVLVPITILGYPFHIDSGLSSGFGFLYR